jgi:O-succinylbenzoate synthase
MKILSSPYTLHGRVKRHGALLRVDYPDGKTGYADLHPWPELGDESLQEQLIKIKKGLLTQLTKRSLYFAKMDAEARANGVSLLAGRKIPLSHYLAHIGEPIPEEGWTTVKIKVKQNQLDDLIKFLPHVHQKVRLDCNSKMDLDCLEKLKPFFNKIEFIEDPAPYHPKKWVECLTKHDIRFAIDRLDKDILESIPSCINIYKPAVESYRSHPHTVVTSYLGHPLGQVCAAYEASLLPKQLLAGLQSHRVYQPNSFSEQLAATGPAFVAPPGTGFGFDELLEQLDWQP